MLNEENAPQMPPILCYTKSMNKTTKSRKKVVKRAVANEQLEGLEVSRASTKIADNYITGKASAKQAATKIRARYGVL